MVASKIFVLVLWCADRLSFLIGIHGACVVLAWGWGHPSLQYACFFLVPIDLAGTIFLYDAPFGVLSGHRLCSLSRVWMSIGCGIAVSHSALALKLAAGCFEQLPMYATYLPHKPGASELCEETCVEVGDGERATLCLKEKWKVLLCNAGQCTRLTQSIGHSLFCPASSWS